MVAETAFGEDPERVIDEIPVRLKEPEPQWDQKKGGQATTILNLPDCKVHPLPEANRFLTAVRRLHKAAFPNEAVLVD